VFFFFDERRENLDLKTNKCHIWKETLRSDSIEMQQLFTEPNIHEIPDPILANP